MSEVVPVDRAVKALYDRRYEVGNALWLCVQRIEWMERGRQLFDMKTLDALFQEREPH